MTIWWLLLALKTGPRFSPPAVPGTTWMPVT